MWALRHEPLPTQTVLGAARIGPLLSEMGPGALVRHWETLSDWGGCSMPCSPVGRSSNDV